MDAPLYDADFAAIVRRCQLVELEGRMRGRGVPLMVADLRSLIVEMDRGVIVKRHWRETWESEGVVFGLGVESELAELGPRLRHLFDSDYDRRWTTSAHRQENGTQRRCPRARPEGVLVAGFDPLSVDHIATQVMGFDPNLIRDQRRGAQLTRCRLTRSELPIRVVSRQPEWRGAIQPGSSLNFEPHYAWKEYLQSFTSATD